MIKNKLIQLVKPVYRWYRNRPIINVFHTSYEKRVLISYITHPFREGIKNKHSNYQESWAIAQIFNELGFIVDVYYQEDNQNINFAKYDVIFGVGEPLERNFRLAINR